MNRPRPSFQAQRWRHLRRRLVNRADARPALVLDDVTLALGRNPENDQHHRIGAPVPTAQIAGTVARPLAFDRSFRPRHAHLRGRWEHQVGSSHSGSWPPVELVRVGDVFFVEDGHHRVSVARARGQRYIDAAVRSLCTIAFAPDDLERDHLAAKAAERDFLRLVPLPDPELRTLRLTDPAAYRRLGANARAWSDRNGLTSPRADCTIDTAVARAWWRDHVLPHGGPAALVA